jgi:hypothetical protein
MTVDSATPRGTNPADPAEPHTDPGLARRKLVTGVLALPLFFLIFLPGLFIGALHSPAPDGMNVAVIGDGPQAVAAVEQAGASSAFDIGRLPDAEAAQTELRDLAIRAAYDPATGDLYIASAGGTQSTAAAQQFFSALAHSAGTAVHVHDVAPLPSADALGNGALYLGIGAIVGGMLAGLIISMVASTLRVRSQLLTLALTAAAVAAIETCYGWTVFDLFSGNAWAGAAILAGLALVAGLVTLSGARVIGPAMIMVSILVLVLGGVTASGLPTQLDMAPEFYRWIHEVLPTARGLSALRNIVYFDGHAITGDLLVMAVWSFASLVALALTRRRRTDVPDFPALDDMETDEAVATAGAATSAAV